MQKSILHGLYNGDILPFERKEQRSEALLDLVGKIEDEERYFMEKMSLDDCQRFQAYTKLHSALGSAGEEDLFAYSFSLGLLLMVDVMKEADVFMGNGAFQDRGK